MKTITLFLLVISVSFVLADPTNSAPAQTPPAANSNDWTVNGRTYHNVIVGTVEADQVHITYDGGIGSVPLSELPPDVQKQLGYDPQKAATAAQIRVLQAQVSDLSEQNATLRQALARYQGALSDAQTQAQAKPKSSIAAFDCYLYQLTSSGMATDRVGKAVYRGGEVAGYTKQEAYVYAQQKWAQMPDSEKAAYEQMATTTGDPMAKEAAQAALQPPDTQHHGAREQTVVGPDGMPTQQTIIDP